MNFLRKIKIGKRLYIMFGFLIVMLLIIAFSGIMSRLDLIDKTKSMQVNYVDSLSMIAEVNVVTGNLFLSYRNYYLEYPDKEKMQVRLNDINNRTDFILTNLQAYQKLLIDRNAPQEEVDVANNAIAKVQDEVVPFNEKLIKLMQSEQIDEVRGLIISSELRSLRSELQDDLITAIYDNCTENINSVLDGNINEMKNSNITIIIMVIFGFMLLVFISFQTVNSIVKPIEELMLVSKEITLGKIDVNLPKIHSDEVGELTEQFGDLVEASRGQAEIIKRIADGDLTGSYVPRSGDDVVGHSIVDMLELNNSALSQVFMSANQLSEAISQIACGAQTLAESSTEQAATVQELSAAIAKISGSTAAGANTAKEASGLSDAIKNNAEKGRGQMEHMVVAVKEINDANQSINKVIKVIDDIAFQTNILALNAAVEAARAGQYGKGFAVVADEVRTLAAKSADAVKDTGVLITNSIEKAVLGVKIADETAYSLNKIIDGINQNADLVNNIAKSYEQQNTAIDRINISIDQVTKTVQQNSATSQQSAASCEEMSAQAESLNNLVSRFQLN